MCNRVGLEFHGRSFIAPLESHKKPSLLQLGNGAAEGTADIIFVEIGIGVRALEGGRGKVCFAIKIIEGPCSQGGVLVVVNGRAVVFGAAALGTHADVGDASVLRTEVRREDIDLAHSFQRRLAVCWLAKTTATRPLAIE